MRILTTDKTLCWCSMGIDFALRSNHHLDISRLVDSCTESESPAKQALLQLATGHQAIFSRAAIAILASSAPSPGTRYLVQLLAKQGLLLDALTDPARSSDEEAVGAARAISQAGSPLENELQRMLVIALRQTATSANTAKTMRLIELLGGLSAQSCWPMFKSELMAYPDGRVRSRAAYLIAKATRNAAWVGKMLGDDDPAVQANAIEALWTFPADEARPVLLAGVRSPHHRVVANSALGLYRLGEQMAIRKLLEMLASEDAACRATAIWAIQETGDPRFLPSLMDHFQKSGGNERLSVTKALARIRRREKSIAESGTVDIRILESVILSDGSRRLAFNLWAEADESWSNATAMDFVLQEGRNPVVDYRVSFANNPALVLAGFLMPRIETENDPVAKAMATAIQRCLRYKRTDDQWRVDRYLLEKPPDPTETDAKPAVPNSPGPGDGRTQRGFVTGVSIIQKMSTNPGPPEAAAATLGAGLQRLFQIMATATGRRHLFFFVGPDERDFAPSWLASMEERIREERISLHAIACEQSAGLKGLEQLCRQSPGGTVILASPEEIPDCIESVYSQTLNRFEIAYNPHWDGDAASDGSITFYSARGIAKANYSLTPAPDGE